MSFVTNICVLLVAMSPAAFCLDLRITNGVLDKNNDYPYVVVLLSARPNDIRRGCTGSVITPDWVLTAAHCLSYDLVQYGNVSIPANLTKSLVRVLKSVSNPYSMGLSNNVQNDVGLLMVEKINIDIFGKLSAVDYKTLIGAKIVIVGGTPLALNGSKIIDETKALLLGEALIVKCLKEPYTIPGLCLATKCVGNKQRLQNGDSGGPAVYGNRIVGVHSTVDVINEITGLSQQMIAPISPLINWISDVVNEKIKT